MAAAEAAVTAAAANARPKTVKASKVVNASEAFQAAHGVLSAEGALGRRRGGGAADAPLPDRELDRVAGGVYPETLTSAAGG